MNRALFQAPQSAFDPSFWEKLYDQKLNVLKLDSSAQQLSASITCSAGQRNQAIEFTAQSHAPSDSKGNVSGFLYNVNTVEVSEVTAPLLFFC
jgi:capsular polysaccharide biosynthesis protein